MNFFLLGGEFFFDVIVERARQRSAVARQMRASVLLRNVVRVAVHALLVRIIPLQRDLDVDQPFLRAESEHVFVHWRAAAIQVLDEGLQSALVLEHVALVFALVVQFDAHAGIEE